LYSNLITASLQLVDKLATSMLRTHLVDKLWDFYVCTRRKPGTLILLKCSWDYNQ
jgi:hypothetical protein